MDERFRELARLVAEQLAQRWMEHAAQGEPSRAEHQGEGAVVEDEGGPELDP